jgi:energy-converting hydrogenase Eha subunit B
MKLAGWIGLALSIAPFSTFAASIRDTVLVCNNGSPCTILIQSTTGPVIGSSPLFSGTASGSADATGGILHASSSYDFITSAPQSGQVNGNAQFLDQLTIDDAGLTGTIGYLVPTFAVTGSVSGPADGVVGFFLNASQGCTSTGTNFCQTIRVTGNSMVSFNPITFTFGQPFSFEMDLGTEAFYASGGGLNAAANFSHTALLNGLHVFQNSDGTNPVPSQNLTFTSSGDVSYSVNGIVPEPASVLLVVCGLACIAAISQKRKTL